MRVGVPNRLRDWPRWSGHERNHLGESCCFFGMRDMINVSDMSESNKRCVKVGLIPLVLLRSTITWSQSNQDPRWTQKPIYNHFLPTIIGPDY